MALRITGRHQCPYCGQDAIVGISRAGTGNAVHLICIKCQTQVQAHRGSAVAQLLLGGENPAAQPEPPRPPRAPPNQQVKVQQVIDDIDWSGSGR